MWRNVKAFEREKFLANAIEFTGNSEAYGAAMHRVIEEFPIACEHNLTDIGQNRQAWIGHAACYLAFECPEDIVREAWGMLTELQRIEANCKAHDAIEKWVTHHNEKQNPQLCLDLEEAGLHV